MQEIMHVIDNINIAKDVYRMTLSGDTSRITRPGQFVNIRLPGYFLRRPISVCDWIPEDVGEAGELTLIYKVVGHGTDAMSELKFGDTLDMLMGLGNGFDVNAAGEAPILIGGGVGTPPIYGLARRLVLAGKSVDVVLGFNAAEDVFGVEAFDDLNDLYEFGCEGFEGERPTVRVHLATVSGELGTKGFVTDCLKEMNECSHYYACGPLPMLKAVKEQMDRQFPGVIGELSFEERMGCGFGACVGCSIETTEGFKKVCKDGPVFASNTVLQNINAK